MSLDAYGRWLVGLSLNLIVHNVEGSLPFHTDILNLHALYHDVDFAALVGLNGA
jgi:hypothetical protein